MAADSRFYRSLQILAALAGKPGEPQNSYSLGRRLRTDPVVIRRTVGELSRAGLVVSRRGPGGGNLLAKPAHKIMLGDVYLATEKGPPFAFPAFAGAPVRGLNEALEKSFYTAESGMVEVLAEISIADLLK